MTHIVTLSGNSRRFTDRGFAHKALCRIGGRTVIDIFVSKFRRFDHCDTIFLCRSEDLQTTSLEREIKLVAPTARIYGIEANSLGPVYSISRIFDKIDDSQPVLVTYIDSIQKIDLVELESVFSKYEGGITLHDFQNPHWRSNKSFCLVTHDSNSLAVNIAEKFDFSKFDFSSKSSGGSSGSYYFCSGSLMKIEFKNLMEKGVCINNEYYVSQALNKMIYADMNVKCGYYPYVCLGTPEDVEDCCFWFDWFNG